MIDCISDQLRSRVEKISMTRASRLIQVKFVLTSSMVVYVYLVFLWPWIFLLEISLETIDNNINLSWLLIWRVRNVIVSDCLGQMLLAKRVRSTYSSKVDVGHWHWGWNGYGYHYTTWVQIKDAGGYPMVFFWVNYLIMVKCHSSSFLPSLKLREVPI